MKRYLKARTAAAAVVVTAAALGLCGCNKEAATRAPSQEKARVRLEPVRRADMSEFLKLNGEVVAASTVVLTPKVPGRLEELSVQDADGKPAPLVEGTRLNAGQRIGVIDHATYEARDRQAQAAVGAAKAQFDDAVREEQRILSLLKEGAATEQMRDKTITGRRAAGAAMSQAQAALDLAEIDREESALKSPIDGTVTARHVDAGNVVSPGMPIVTIQDVSHVKVLFGVPERYLLCVHGGKTPVTISTDALGASSITGVVARVHPSVDKATRTIAVEVILDNRDGRLRPGMFARVEVETMRKEGVPVVPAAGVLRSGEDTYVFVANGARVARRPVELGIQSRDRWEVRKGLEEGDMVAVSGHRLLRDGQDIEVVREATK